MTGNRIEGPVHDLAQAKSLVQSGEYDYDDGKSCARILLECFGTMIEAITFIERAFELVGPDDYCGSVDIQTAAIRGKYDAYAFAVPDSAAEQFNLRQRHWYLKFKITTVRGQKVFVLSLHPLYKNETRRRAGPLARG